MTTDPGHKTVDEIEREIEEDRARFGRTVDELRDRMSVGALIDEFTQRSKLQGSDVAATLGRAIRDNPIPVAIIGACLLWMVAGGQEASTRRDWYGAKGRQRLPDGEPLPESEALHPVPPVPAPAARARPATGASEVDAMPDRPVVGGAAPLGGPGTGHVATRPVGAPAEPSRSGPATGSLGGGLGRKSQ